MPDLFSMANRPTASGGPTADCMDRAKRYQIRVNSKAATKVQAATLTSRLALGVT